MAARNYKMDMCRGPLTGKIVRYAIPLVATYLLQNAFHLADIFVISRFAETHRSLAAIGTTTDLNALMLNMIWGIAVGGNVVVAQCFGSGDRKSLSHAVHTVLALAIILGLTLFTLGSIFSRSMLVGINAQGEVLEKATLYWRICLCGAPFMLIYAYCCSVLRALGDTRRPLMFLVFSGSVNVTLNLLFVIVFKLDVAGVALATAFSHALSAFLVLRVMLKGTGPERIIVRHIRPYWPQVKRMLHIGIPAGFQGACFSLSNVIIQSAINSLGDYAMAGNTAALQFEAIPFVIVIAIYHTAMAFAGQNYGARKYERVRRSVLVCIGLICAVIISLGGTILCFGHELIGFLKPDPLVIEQGFSRLRITMSTYFLLGIVDVFTGGLRGIGRSVTPMVVTLLGVCVFRLVWIWTVFPRYRSIASLFISYPISWSLVALINGPLFFFIVARLIRKKRAETETEKAAA